MNKKGIGPVIASSLLIVVAVVAIIGFQTWFNSYSTTLFSDVESKSSSSVSQTKIDQLLGDTLYFRNGFTENLTITDVKIGGNSCNLGSLTANGDSLTQISLNSNCTTNLTSSKIEAVVYTNKGPYSTYFYNRNVSASASLSSNESEEESVSSSYSIGNSLRFNDDDTAYLNRTPTSEGNRTTWTWSGWVKKADGTTNAGTFFSVGVTSGFSDTNFFALEFSPTYQISGTTGATNFIKTNSIYRDPTTWMNIVLSVDTRKVLATDQVQLYINGIQETDLATSTALTQNLSLAVSSADDHRIGYRVSSTGLFDGYLSEVNFIDGQALGPEYFGENDSYGNWQPIEYSGTYGTNGFYLPFNDSSNIGQDYSNNSNNFTSNNLDSSDVVLDSPTNNFATLNPLFPTSTNYPYSATFSQGNLMASMSGSGASGVSTTIFPTSGKWYAEFNVTTKVNTNFANFDLYLYTSSNSLIGGYDQTGQWYSGGWSGGSGDWEAWSQGDILGIAWDIDVGNVSFYKNNILQGSGFSFTAGTSAAPFIYSQVANVMTANYGQGGQGNLTYNSSAGGSFVYTPPSGFKALSVININNVTGKVNASEYFDILTYTGNGAVRNITGLSFSPDLVWIKNRDTTDEHKLIDSLRGVTKELSSDSTAVEGTDSNGLTNFNSDGFELGTGASGYNDNTEDFVSWNWEESQESGFDIVTYTGTGSQQSISHNLNKTPKMFIIKELGSSSYSWQVYNEYLDSSNPQNYRLLLNDATARASSATIWSTLPNSTHFTVDTSSGVNGNTDEHIAYLFAEKEGFSKIGSYTGNGNANGPFIYTGFKPAYVMIKNINLARNWVIADLSLSNSFLSNPVDNFLFPDVSNSQSARGPLSGSDYYIDLLSNGFKIRTVDSALNDATDNYIYIAFAEKPLN